MTTRNHTETWFQASNRFLDSLEDWDLVRSCTNNISYELTDDLREELAKLFETLPGYRGLDDSGCQLWFGGPDEHANLIGSVEPSGFLVEGNVSDANWIKWDQAFRDGASKILGFEVRDAEL